MTRPTGPNGARYVGIDMSGRSAGRPRRGAVAPRRPRRSPDQGNQPFAACRIVAVAGAEVLHQCALLNADAEHETARNDDSEPREGPPVADEPSDSDEDEEQTGVTRVPDQPVGTAGDHRLLTARLDCEGEVTTKCAKAPEPQGDAAPEQSEPDPVGERGGPDRRRR